MKRLLNEEFLYNGDLYFIKSIVETFQPYICDSCPFNKVYFILSNIMRYISSIV